MAYEIKAKLTEHRYTEWRRRIGEHHLQVILSRLEQRQRRDGEHAVFTDDQRLIMQLVQILDEGGETLEYVRALADAE